MVVNSVVLFGFSVVFSCLCCCFLVWIVRFACMFLKFVFLLIVIYVFLLLYM